jgi:hypothetical protein
MINRKTKHRKQGKTGPARENLDVQDYQGGSQLETLGKAAAL